MFYIKQQKLFEGPLKPPCQLYCYFNGSAGRAKIWHAHLEQFHENLEEDVNRHFHFTNKTTEGAKNFCQKRYQNMNSQILFLKIIALLFLIVYSTRSLSKNVDHSPVTLLVFRTVSTYFKDFNWVKIIKLLMGGFSNLTFVHILTEIFFKFSFHVCSVAN